MVFIYLCNTMMFKIRLDNICYFVLLLNIVGVHGVCLCVIPNKFQDCFFQVCEEYHWYFDSNFDESFWYYEHFDNIYPSNPLCVYSLHFIWYRLYNSHNRNISLFIKFIPRYLIFLTNGNGIDFLICLSDNFLIDMNIGLVLCNFAVFFSWWSLWALYNSTSSTNSDSCFCVANFDISSLILISLALPW